MLLTILARLVALRAFMIDPAVINPPLDAYIIPLNDAHQGTRVPACSARLQFISDFTGSSGYALVTATKALLWTDGRYFTQANDELSAEWTLMREGVPDTPSLSEFLRREFGSGARIGVDPSLYSKTSWTALETSLKAADQQLVAVDENLIDKVWNEQGDRPACPKEPLTQIPLSFTGKSTTDKLKEVKAVMDNRGVKALVINQLDDIAWLLNLRGLDIPSAALFLSFVIIKDDTTFDFFIDQDKLNPQIRQELESIGAHIFDYSEVTQQLRDLVSATDGKIWLDKTCGYSLVNLVPDNRQHIELSPIIPIKSVKNPNEIAGFKNALIRDAAYLARFYAWLEIAINAGANVTELSASARLQELRQENPLFLTTSFTTIAGADSNGAIIHYRPTEKTNKQITKNSMFLVDAGATYQDGTTDITRTFHFGTPSDFQKECYTRVLKGQVAIARAVFPQRSRGNRLDSFARKFLWDIGLDYGHGTGHGIGINVHEGPSRISYDYSLASDDQGLRENMLSSNEPGYYEEGLFGIRLENIVRVVNSSVTGVNNQPFLEIEDMTFLPYQHKLIKKELLTKPEIDYLNGYQTKVRDIVGAYIRQNYPGDPAIAWITKETPNF